MPVGIQDTSVGAVGPWIPWVPRAEDQSMVVYCAEQMQPREELTRHMQKEEIVPFPYIEILVTAERNRTPANPPPFRTIPNPITMIEMAHRSAEDAFSFIRSESAGFTPPPDACTTFTVTHRELEEFERDLHRHVHLENNTLLPKAIELQHSVLSRAELSS